MAIELIAKIKPKNNGDFPMVDAADVEMADGTRLEDAAAELASTLTTIGQTVVLQTQAIGQKQNTLVSGKNIKTVNGQSLLGEGDITIEAGTDLPSVTAADNGKVLVVNENGEWVAMEMAVSADLPSAEGASF